MKKIFSLLLAVCLALALTACGGAKETPAPDSSAGAATDTPAKTYKVAMICDSAISDGGWGAACYNGMVDAATANGWETAYTDSIDQSAYADSMISYCDLGYDMIFAPGNQYSDAVVQVAADYPNVFFAVLNGSETLPTANIASILPDAKQIGSIAGIIAGTMSKSNVIGFIGGMELDTTKAKLANFESAAKTINPSISAVSAYAGSFNDTAKGMELAASMINDGADVFFGDASAVDSGARQAIDQKNGTGAIGIFDIGQPADLLGQNPCVVCSVVTDNAGMIGLCMKDVQSGTFGNKVVYGNLENGCVYLGKFNDELVDADTQTKITDYVKALQDGTFGK
ncbi:MAG: BMP family ABC transporter substrate-binding protein [Firmicutes bacterium HGW-Firmicutes-16]|nr:MAG: BMP family ABC transporter substrate-binding protein [Firmicutes bacterium HGW-Firmicutes-16]